MHVGFRWRLAVMAAAVLALPAAQAHAAVLFRASYGAGLGSWQAVQEAAAGRISSTGAPGDPADPFRPATPVMRVDVRAGELTETGGTFASRSEVYARTPRPIHSTPADRWPDPPGAVRWYGFDFYVAPGFATSAKWLMITQLKGYEGGSPPIALEIKRDRFRFGGALANSGALPAFDLGPIRPGTWTRFVLGVRFST